MRRALIVMVASLVVLTACASGTGDDASATSAAETALASDSGDATPAEATRGADEAPSIGVETAASPSDEGAGSDEADGADAADAAATPDATTQAFYDGFELPERGDPDAAVVLYEFSDYT